MIRKALYLLLVVFTVTACGDKGDGLGLKPKKNIDAAARAAGTYAISRYAISGSSANDIDLTLPETGTLNGKPATRTGILTVTKNSETVIAVKLSFVTTGQTDVNIDLGTADIKDTDLYNGSTKIGMADGTTFTVDETDSGVRLFISATKK